MPGGSLQSARRAVVSIWTSLAELRPPSFSEAQQSLLMRDAKKVLGPGLVSEAPLPTPSEHCTGSVLAWFFCA